MKIPHAVVAFAICLMGAALPADADPASAAKPLTVGDALPVLSLHDQHGAAAAVGESTAVVLFTRDMDSGAHVKEALAEKGGEMLPAAMAVYVSDVSGMPGFVRSTFAVPAMRKRPYPIVLDETGEATAAFPSEQGKVTVLALDAGRIAAIAYASSAAEVRAALQK